MLRDQFGIETVLHRHNDGQGTITFETRQDVSGIVADAKARHNEGMHGTSEMKHAARIPEAAIDAYCNQHNITFQEWCNDKKHIREMLNDPMLRDFRIWPGRV